MEKSSTLLNNIGKAIVAICVVLSSLLIITIFKQFNQPHRLEKPVTSLSPDGKINFVLATDGSALLIQKATKKILHKRRISPATYTSVAVRWRDNQHLAVTCIIRYQMTAHQQEYLWDCRSGLVTADWSRSVHDFQ